MSISKRIKKCLISAATAVSLAAAGHAQAIVAFSIGSVNSADPGFAPGEASVVTFDAASALGMPEADQGPVDSVRLFTLTHVDVAAAPVGDTTQFAAIQPGGSAKYNFANYTPGVGSLSVYVGSIDTYNMFEISTNHFNYFFDGTDFLHNNGDQFSNQTNRRVYFQFANGDILKSLTMSSDGIAFEYDDIAAAPYGDGRPAWVSASDDVQALLPTRTEAVPEPTAWALMLGGVALIGAIVRRRQAAAAA